MTFSTQNSLPSTIRLVLSYSPPQEHPQSIPETDREMAKMKIMATFISSSSGCSDVYVNMTFALSTGGSWGGGTAGGLARGGGE